MTPIIICCAYDSNLVYYIFENLFLYNINTLNFLGLKLE